MVEQKFYKKRRWKINHNTKRRMKKNKKKKKKKREAGKLRNIKNGNDGNNYNNDPEIRKPLTLESRNNQETKSNQQ